MLDQLIQDLEPLAREYRQHLHQYPELSGQEEETAAFVAKVLTDLNIPHQTGIGGHGVVGHIIGGHPGPTLLIRGDMDALPIQEATGLPFQSLNPGVMHACGHDIHTTNLLILAHILTHYQDQIHGQVLLVFQPAEEGHGGAQAMIDDGILDQVTIDAALALHVDPTLPLGAAAIEPGPITAFPEFFTVTIKGKGGHGALPFLAIDPIQVGVHFHQLVKDIPTSLNPLHPIVIQICAFQAGQAPAVIPDSCLIKGTVRSHYDQDRLAVYQKMTDIIQSLQSLYPVEIDFDYVTMARPVINDPQLTHKVQEICGPIFDQGLRPSLHFKMVGEDFSVFADRIPACMLVIGCSNPSQAPHHLHTAQFNPDENVLLYGIRAFSHFAFDYLSIQSPKGEN